MSEWISTKEKQPKSGTYNLVTARMISGELVVRMWCYGGRDYGWRTSGECTDVIAWMPCPEPYEDGD